MRYMSPFNKAIVNAGPRNARARVSVLGAPGFVDLTSIPGGQDFVLSVTWKEDIDSNGLTATVTLVRESDEWSLSPLAEYSPLNHQDASGNYSPGNPFLPLIDIGKRIQIETCVCPDLSLEPTDPTWLTSFLGFIDSVDWSDNNGTLKLECAGLEAALRDTWIERERIYALATGGIGGVLSFEPNQAYVGFTDYLVPSADRLNGCYYQCTIGGVSGATEPVWPTAVNATVVSGTATFKRAGVTSVAASEPVENIIRKIISNNNLPPAFALATSPSPGWMIRAFAQQRESVWSAITKLAQQIGWALRYKANSSGGFELYLYDVLRARTTTDYIFQANEYLSVDAASKNITQIRNAVRVIYSDSNDRDPQQVPKRKQVTAIDAVSIAKYGRRFMEITESSASNIDTTAEATTLANAILSDLKDPNFDFAVTVEFFPWVELADRYIFQPNGRHFSSDQVMAVVGFEHMISGGEARTKITCRGTPSIGTGRWLSQDGRVAPEDVHGFVYQSPSGVSSQIVTPTIGGLSVSQISDILLAPRHVRSSEVHVSPTPGFVASAGTLKGVTTPGDRSIFGDLEPGGTYYVQTIPVMLNADRVVRGLPSIEQTIVAGRAKAGHYDSASTQSHLPLNGNFEHSTRDIALKPPDHWELKALSGEPAESWSAAGSVFWGLDADKGRYLSLRPNATTRGRAVSSVFEVRRGIRALNFNLSIRRQGSSAVSGKDLILDIFGFKLADDITPSINYSVFLGGSATGPYPLLNTWYEVPIDFGAGYGQIPPNINFLQVVLRRGAVGDTSFSWEIGDVYAQEADFTRLKVDALDGNIVTQAWQTPTFVSGWQNFNTATYQSAAYCKDAAGFVHLRGLVQRVSGASAIIFNLPAGYRPLKQCLFAVDSNNAHGRTDVLANGDVTLTVGTPASFASLDGITFDTR
jgi:hypothetical protein